MFVPFGVRDFLDRAETVYEPTQPAPPLEGLTYARIGELVEPS